MQNLRQKGFIQWIILVIVLILIVSYFGIDLTALIESERFQNNLEYVIQILGNIWNTYLKEPLGALLKAIFKPFFAQPTEYLDYLDPEGFDPIKAVPTGDSVPTIDPQG